MSNRSWYVLGMSLFTAALVLFISLSFFVDIPLDTKEVQQLAEEKNEGLAKNLSKAPYGSIVNQVNYLKVSFDDYNQSLKDQFGISEQKADQVIADLGEEANRYDEKFIENNFDAEQVKLVKGGTSWMIGREWASFEEFTKNFRWKVQDINQQIAEEKGIPASDRNDRLFALLYAGTPAWLKSGWAAFLIFGLALLGGFVTMVPLLNVKAGIQHNGIYHRKRQNAMGSAWIVFAGLIGFYIVLYHFAHFIAPQAALLDPLADKLAGNASSQWFLYGFLYTISMGLMGFRMLLKYKGNAYQQVRTVSVFFFQVVFAFTLPQILTRLQMPAYDMKSAWPLEYSFFFDYRIKDYLESGDLGLFLLFWGIVLFAVGVPVFTYFFGKRWYCSWVCGCGGLAETLGDPYRQLSDKSLKAWKIERWLVHGVLVFAVGMTALAAYTSFTGEAEILGINSYSVRSTYGFFIGFVFAGAVGTGFYPVMGNRVWCRFGCPLAAYLGIVQRFKSRFRITTNGGQCISCGNCSTYCEMGIDVRAYAQKGQNIVRSSCVGCGVCASVCPRGVLKLENNGSVQFNDNPILIGSNSVSLQN